MDESRAVDIFKHSGRIIRACWKDLDSYKAIVPITQVAGICFDAQGKICIVRTAHDTAWTLPGGTPEKGETPEQTLAREVKEEASVSLKRFSLIGAAENFVKANPKKREGGHFFQLRFVAMIDNILEMQPDPDLGHARKRKFISPDEFLGYIPWGNLAKAMLDAALRRYERLR